jgi:hypothetical protein
MGRTVEAVNAALKTLLDTIAPIECQNYIKAAGYRSD